MISIAEIAVTLSLSSFVPYFNRKMQIVCIVEDLLDSRLRKLIVDLYILRFKIRNIEIV